MSLQEIIQPQTAQWADRINTAWDSGVASILETSRLIHEAKQELARGEWSRLIGDNDHPGMLRFKARFANMLARVGRNYPRLLQHAAVLPSDSTTLDKLCALSEDRFQVMLEDGSIHPGMKRNDASAETRKESKAADEARILSLAPREGIYRTLVIDPPWDYEWLSLAGRAAPGYATMSHDELLALDVGQWADDDCHMYLWTTNNFITRAADLMAHWGFQHKTVLTWVKPRWGLGAYFRNSTEHVLFGVRGNLRTRSDSIATHFEAPMGDHSEKPDKFYEIVTEASYLPAGEVFQRKEREGFENVFEVSEGLEAAAESA